jgi:uncharacterized protein YxjI
MTEPADLLSAPTVVVSQRPKVLSQRAEYDLYAADGQALGSVVEQPGSGKWLLGKLAELRFVISDAAGRPVLVLDKPGSWGRQHFAVQDPSGVQLGEIQQESMFFAPQFDLRASDGSTGRQDGGRMMSWERTIEGVGGQPIGRVTKKLGGLAAFLMSADNYVVELAPDLGGPLRVVALTACLCLDVVRAERKRSNSG